MNRKQTKKKQTLEPNKKYVWEPDDVFNLTGLEIDKINRALGAVSSTPEFQRFIAVFEGIQAFNSFFQNAVEEGAIKAVPDDEPEKDSPEEAVVVVEEQNNEKQAVS